MARFRDIMAKLRHFFRFGSTTVYIYNDKILTTNRRCFELMEEYSRKMGDLDREFWTKMGE